MRKSVLLQKLYEEMEQRIEAATKLGGIPEEASLQHKGFSQWDPYSSPSNHDTVLQVINISCLKIL